MIRFVIETASGKTISGMAESLDKIETAVLAPELDDPEVVAAIAAKYGTLETRQRKVAAAASAQDAVSKLDFDALREDARAAAQMNPDGSRAALAALVETLIDVVEKLTTMTKGN